MRRLAESLLRRPSAEPPQEQKKQPEEPIIADLDDWGHLLPHEFVQLVRDSGWGSESFANLFQKFKFTTPQHHIKKTELPNVRSARAEQLMNIFGLRTDNTITSDLLGAEKIRLPIRDGLGRVARIQEVRNHDLEQGNLPIANFLDIYTDLPETSKKLITQILEEVFSCHTICDVYILGVENLEVKHPLNHDFSYLYRKQLAIMVEHVHWFLDHDTSYVPPVAQQAQESRQRIQSEPDDEGTTRHTGDIYNGDVSIDNTSHEEGVGCVTRATQLLVFGLLFSSAVVWTGSKADLWKMNWSKIQALFEPSSDQNR